MTTALSPDSRMSIQMICRTETKNWVEKYSMVGRLA